MVMQEGSRVSPDLTCLHLPQPLSFLPASLSCGLSPLHHLLPHPSFPGPLCAGVSGTHFCVLKAKPRPGPPSLWSQTRLCVDQEPRFPDGGLKLVGARNPQINHSSFSVCLVGTLGGWVCTELWDTLPALGQRGPTSPPKGWDRQDSRCTGRRWGIHLVVQDRPSELVLGDEGVQGVGM